jgi:hypothetical protein
VKYFMTFCIKALFNKGYHTISLFINKWANNRLGPVRSGVESKSRYVVARRSEARPGLYVPFAPNRSEPDLFARTRFASPGYRS